MPGDRRTGGHRGKLEEVAVKEEPRACGRPTPFAPHGPGRRHTGSSRLAGTPPNRSGLAREWGRERSRPGWRCGGRGREFRSPQRRPDILPRRLESRFGLIAVPQPAPPCHLVGGRIAGERVLPRPLVEPFSGVLPTGMVACDVVAELCLQMRTRSPSRRAASFRYPGDATTARPRRPSSQRITSSGCSRCHHSGGDIPMRGKRRPEDLRPALPGRPGPRRTNPRAGRAWAREARWGTSRS